MREYGFSLTRILPYKNRIVDSVLIRENTGQCKTDSCKFYAMNLAHDASLEEWWQAFCQGQKMR